MYRYEEFREDADHMIHWQLKALGLNAKARESRELGDLEKAEEYEKIAKRSWYRYQEWATHIREKYGSNPLLAR